MAASYYVARGGEESVCLIDLANCCQRTARKTDGDFECPKCGAGWIADRHEKEEAYREHRAREGYAQPHPDGCFYCGSYDHTSGCCPESEEITEYWGRS